LARSIHVTLTSDKSGEPIPAGTGARIRVLFHDDRLDMRADLTDTETEQLIEDYNLTSVEPRPSRRRNTR
jgi:hypothetical protein